MDALRTAVDSLARDTGFSGVVRVDAGGRTVVLAAYGLADRRHGVPVTPASRFATASATKGLTAVTVLSLIADGSLSLDTPARSLLRDDLPLVEDGVTVEHLLAHRAGIGDYVDESGGDVADLPAFDVARLDTTAAYLDALDGYPQVFAPGTQFRYCNSGYVVLALLAQRAAGLPFEDLVAQRVCGPAGMRTTSFLRSDTLPGDAAVGYLEAQGLRTNVFHLPVVGSGDSGAYATVADLHAFWDALLDGRLLPPAWVQRMVLPRSVDTGHRFHYGLGFWLSATGDGVVLEGADAGVSVRTACARAAGVTYSVVSNTGDGAWPLARHLDEHFLG